MGELVSIALGKDLLRAIQRRDARGLGIAVRRLRSACSRRVVGSELVAEAMAALRNARQFELAVELADAAMVAGLADRETRKLYAQSLIELGLLTAAESELEELLREDLDRRQRGEVLGLLGRNYKQRFANADEESGYRSDLLRRAIEFYARAYDGRSDPAWHGVNLVALLARAERDGIPLAGKLRRPVEPLARDVLAVARGNADEELRNVWERSTEVETLLALGEGGKAREVAERLCAADLANPFELASLRRQLVEIWQLGPADALLAAIDNSTLALGAAAAVDVPVGNFEKLFGNVPVGYTTYHRGLEVARFVGMVTDASGEGWGTGFLLPGCHLHDGLGDEPVFLTNAHVVSTQRGIAPLVPAAARVCFEVLEGADGRPVEIEFSDDDELFTSDPYELDCTILKVRGEVPRLERPIQVAPSMPVVAPDAYVYVIGHPMRGGLAFSIRGNELLGLDAELRRIHYRAPTEKGSSGSPVFDKAWQLIGLHHYGSEKMRSLDGRHVVYQANEGIAIPAIRCAFMAEYRP